MFAAEQMIFFHRAISTIFAFLGKHFRHVLFKIEIPMTEIFQASQESLLIGNTIESGKLYRSDIPKQIITGPPTYPLMLLGLFLAWWIVLAIAPWSRQN